MNKNVRLKWEPNVSRDDENIKQNVSNFSRKAFERKHMNGEVNERL